MSESKQVGEHRFLMPVTVTFDVDAEEPGDMLVTLDVGVDHFDFDGMAPPNTDEARETVLSLIRIHGGDWAEHAPAEWNV
jgi:hypothetical protein